MLPANILNTLKALALDQKPLVTAPAEVTPKSGTFELGQRLQGSVQAQVAPGLFKVNVAGQLVQMQLPPSIRSGDTVALQVVSMQPRLTFTMVNSANPLSTPEQLGSAARLLSSMSQQAPEKAYVRAPQNTPLWVTLQPPPIKELAGRLQEALSNSGLFYESHQVQWLEGSRSTAQLLHEPQNLPSEQVRLAMAPNGARAGLPGATDQTATAQGEAGKAVSSDPAADKAGLAQGNAAREAPANNVPGKSAMVNEYISMAATTGDTARAGAPGQPNTQPPAAQLPESKPLNIPEHLQPLVQQQLNALETRQMLWQGNVWPGQDMQWEIHEQPPQTPDEQEQRQWVTQLRLSLPNLGEVAATLRFNSAGLNLTLNADNPQTRTVLGNASTRLVSALSGAGIAVLGTQISQGTQE